MKAAAFLISMIVLLLALPAHANDGDELGSWSLEKLCKKTDKARHADAVFAEIKRRDVFSSQDLELVRSGNIDLGMGEAALQCSWGEPDAVSQWDGDSWHTYRKRVDGQQRTVDVHVIAGQVANVHIRPSGYNVNRTLVGANLPLSFETFSGREIQATGVVPFPACGINCLHGIREYTGPTAPDGYREQ